MTVAVVNDTATIGGISPKQEAAIVVVRDGSIIRRIYGNNPSQEFYNE